MDHHGTLLTAFFNYVRRDLKIKAEILALKKARSWPKDYNLLGRCIFILLLQRQGALFVGFLAQLIMQGICQKSKKANIRLLLQGIFYLLEYCFCNWNPQTSKDLLPRQDSCFSTFDQSLVVVGIMEEGFLILLCTYFMRMKCLSLIEK